MKLQQFRSDLPAMYLVALVAALALSSCGSDSATAPTRRKARVFGIGTDQQGALCFADLAVIDVRFEFSGRCLTDAEWNF